MLRLRKLAQFLEKNVDSLRNYTETSGPDYWVLKFQISLDNFQFH